MKKIIFLLALCFSTFLVKAQSNGFEVIKSMELLDLIYMNLEKYYVDEPNVGNLSKVGIDALLKELDPYTVYYHEANIEDYRMMNTGQYGGIGALIRKIDKYTVIAEPYEGNPAQAAGLKAGDKILSIDGINMINKSSDEVSKALKGVKGTVVKVEYDRPGKGVGMSEVTRDEIKLPDVPYFGMVDQNIGYISLNSFTTTASSNVTKAFDDLKAQGMKSLIFDLRGNGGGLLTESVNIVNLFVPKNQVVVRTKSRVKEENRVYNTKSNPRDLEIPVVVLINESSASASEIVSGTLQDLDRAVIVGRTSFGKGLVQRTVDLKYGSKMKLTIAKYYTPSGRCVQKLDYAHRIDGKVDEIPDSLLTKFQTKNGRTVIDGRGVEPDVTVEDEELSRLTLKLLTENIIFDFATQFAAENDTLPSPENFELTDETYAVFKSFVLKKDFEYSTASEEMLKRLKTIMEQEVYYSDAKKEYDALLEKVVPSKARDLDKFSNQIKELLQNEIVSRYYYQKGRAINSFKNDKMLKEAISILKNEKQYNSILK
ncbi:MAG: S41 family peptidase [Lishizhenia sp.]